MKRLDLFMEAIQTMLGAWGGDTPSEAIWAMNDFIIWLNAEYNLELEGVDEDDYYKNEENFDRKIKAVWTALEQAEQAEQTRNNNG